MRSLYIQRRRDRFFIDLCTKRMVGKPSLFCEDLGRQIHDPFLLAISRGQFCKPNWLLGEQLLKNNVPVHPFIDGKQNSLEKTRFREKRYKLSAIWKKQSLTVLRVCVAGRRNCLSNICIKTDNIKNIPVYSISCYQN